MEVKSSFLPVAIRLPKNQALLSTLATQWPITAPRIHFWYHYPEQQAWLPLQEYSELIETAAQALFPRHPEPMRMFGRVEMEARSQTHTAQKVMQVLDELQGLKFLANLWRTVYSQGEVAVKPTATGADFLLLGVPEFSRSLRQYMTGFFEAGLRLISRKPIVIELQENDPNRWIWKIDWDSPNYQDN